LTWRAPTLAGGLLVGIARGLDFHQVADPSRWQRCLLRCLDHEM
jgi:hypothetical protein